MRFVSNVVAAVALAAAARRATISVTGVYRHASSCEVGASTIALSVVTPAP